MRADRNESRSYTFVRNTLAQYPRLRATRLFEMVRGRGYTGSVVQLRRAVRLIRPAATGTVYRRLTTRHGGDHWLMGTVIGVCDCVLKSLANYCTICCTLSDPAAGVRNRSAIS